MAKTLPSNEHWGRRSGSIREVSIKGVSVTEHYFKQGQWGHGRENSVRKQRGHSLKQIMRRMEE